MAVMYCSREQAEFIGSFNESNNFTAYGLAYDEGVNWIIEQASASIDNHLHKPDGFFMPGGVEIRNEYHDGQDLKYIGYDYMFSQVTGTRQAAALLYLDHRPILSVTSLEENTTGTTWTARTEGRGNDFLVRNSTIVFIQNLPDWDVKNIRVTYMAGYTQTPQIVNMACARLAGHIMQRIVDASKRDATTVSGLTTRQEVSKLTDLREDLIPPDIRRDLEALAPKRYECF